MKNAITKMSGWVLGVFVRNVDAGACIPPDCCHKGLKYTCPGFCTSRAPFCPE